MCVDLLMIMSERLNLSDDMFFFIKGSGLIKHIIYNAVNKKGSTG